MTTLDPVELQKLLEDSARGQHDAFSSLYDKTSSYLYSLALRILNNAALADEVIQEAYVQIWYGAKDYHSDKGSPIAWMGSIVRYRALDLIRREKSQRSRTTAASYEPVLDSIPDPADSAKYSSELQKLLHCLQPIQPEQRTSILLAFYHGLTHAEVAEQVKAPIGTVKSWIRRGLSKIRECMQL
ncbi:MAG: sigma-70 family RNA polymerase sigma factor [Cellvibrionaceae bacterium]